MTFLTLTWLLMLTGIQATQVSAMWRRVQRLEAAVKGNQ